MLMKWRLLHNTGNLAWVRPVLPPEALFSLGRGFRLGWGRLCRSNGGRLKDGVGVTIWVLFAARTDPYADLRSPRRRHAHQVYKSADYRAGHGIFSSPLGRLAGPTHRYLLGPNPGQVRTMPAAAAHPAAWSNYRAVCSSSR